jgi:hypothetical protein
MPRIANTFRNRKRKRGRAPPRPELSEAQILAWADGFHERTGRWPDLKCGPITGSVGENWRAVNGALFHGYRGLPAGGSLARLLARHRGVRNPKGQPPYTVDQIVSWAQAHFRRFQKWPIKNSGPIGDAPNETWSTVDTALRAGVRGLPGGSSLAQLLAEECGKRNIQDLPDMTRSQILRCGSSWTMPCEMAGAGCPAPHPWLSFWRRSAACATTCMSPA